MLYTSWGNTCDYIGVLYMELLGELGIDWNRGIVLIIILLSLDAGKVGTERVVVIWEGGK